MTPDNLKAGISPELLEAPKQPLLSQGVDNQRFLTGGKVDKLLSMPQAK